MKKARRYKIVTGNNKRVLAQGFFSYEDAHDWVLLHDYGQYEAEGGWYIFPYLA